MRISPGNLVSVLWRFRLLSDELLLRLIHLKFYLVLLLSPCFMTLLAELKRTFGHSSVSSSMYLNIITELPRLPLTL